MHLFILLELIEPIFSCQWWYIIQRCCVLVLQTSYIILTVVSCCMSAANQRSFFVLSLCHRESQRLIFSAGCVVKPLAAAVLRVRLPLSLIVDGQRASSSSQGRLLCICKPTAASEGFCYLRVRSCRGWETHFTAHSTQRRSSLCTN